MIKDKRAMEAEISQLR